MTKYGNYEDDREFFTQSFTTTVFEEEEDDVTPTGILDKDGNEYVKISVKERIGFLPWQENK